MSRDQRTPGGLSAKTLLIAAAASAAAALLIPMLWRPGTVFAAAMTPVVVALVSEMLRRPVETVSSVRVRRTATVGPPRQEPFDPLAPPSTEELAVLPESSTTPRAEHRRRPLTGRQWKLAVATGLVAFAAVVVVFTASELVVGEPVSSGDTGTTFFSGSSSKQHDKQQPSSGEKRRSNEPTPTPATSATPTATATTTPTPVATATPTPPPSPAPAEPAPTP